ncbi:hypothetical protein PCE1_002405 [Barthelona sp. PCE]
MSDESDISDFSEEEMETFIEDTKEASPKEFPNDVQTCGSVIDREIGGTGPNPDDLYEEEEYLNTTDDGEMSENFILESQYLDPEECELNSISEDTKIQPFGLISDVYCREFFFSGLPGTPVLSSATVCTKDRVIIGYITETFFNEKEDRIATYKVQVFNNFDARWLKQKSIVLIVEDSAILRE